MQRLPARLDVQQAALLLGFAEHDIPVLIKVRLLKPLGSPAPNGIKWFSAAELEALAQDRAWLDRATKAVQAHWKNRNREKSLASVSGTDGIPNENSERE
jgi:hypothetical protein